MKKEIENVDIYGVELKISYTDGAKVIFDRGTCEAEYDCTKEELILRIPLSEILDCKSKSEISFEKKENIQAKKIYQRINWSGYPANKTPI